MESNDLLKPLPGGDDNTRLVGLEMASRGGIEGRDLSQEEQYRPAGSSSADHAEEGGQKTGEEETNEAQSLTQPQQEPNNFGKADREEFKQDKPRDVLPAEVDVTVIPDWPTPQGVDTLGSVLIGFAIIFVFGIICRA